MSLFFAPSGSFATTSYFSVSIQEGPLIENSLVWNALVSSHLKETTYSVRAASWAAANPVSPLPLAPGRTFTAGLTDATSKVGEVGCARDTECITNSNGAPVTRNLRINAFCHDPIKNGAGPWINLAGAETARDMTTVRQGRSVRARLPCRLRRARDSRLRPYRQSTAGGRIDHSDQAFERALGVNRDKVRATALRGRSLKSSSRHNRSPPCSAVVVRAPRPAVGQLMLREAPRLQCCIDGF